MSSPIDFNQARTLPPVSWHAPPNGCLAEAATDQGTVKLQYGTIQSGRGAGVEVVHIDTGPMQIVVLPTRGMSIWQATCDGVPFQWHSPVDGPVHPSLVPVHDSNGLGWLEGFDELLVRCGMVSNGAPDFDDNGQLKYPLHGRVGNLPADRLSCHQADGMVHLVGEVNERRLFFNNLKLTATLSIAPGGREIQIADTVSNLSAQQAATQMLYHINVGTPLLGEGAKLLVPFEELAPRNAHAASDIPTWDRYAGPTVGFQEQVHFFRMNSDSQGRTAMMLQSSSGDRGLGVSYDTHTLPYFVLWKNTAALEDGYVTGLEPSTNFPNPRTFEGEHERVASIAPGESITHRIRLHPLVGHEQVTDFAAKVQSLKPANPRVHTQPKPDWSA
ncbi:MAG: aldose 1-epimerase family protein [Pirellulaceae bacterium]